MLNLRAATNLDRWEAGDFIALQKVQSSVSGDYLDAAPFVLEGVCPKCLAAGNDVAASGLEIQVVGGERVGVCPAGWVFQVESVLGDRSPGLVPAPSV